MTASTTNLRVGDGFTGGLRHGPSAIGMEDLRNLADAPRAAVPAHFHHKIIKGYIDYTAR
jgi:hypothetical protein